MRKTTNDSIQTCEQVAQGEYALLVRLGKVTKEALSVVKAGFRAKCSTHDADRICEELDRLYNEPSLF